MATWFVRYAASRRLKSTELVCRWAVSRRYCSGRSSSSSSYISSLMTSCSVTRSERPVRRLWISEARRADSTLASRLRSLLREAAIYALRFWSVHRPKDEILKNQPLLVLLMGALRLHGFHRRECTSRRHADFKDLPPSTVNGRLWRSGGLPGAKLVWPTDLKFARRKKILLCKGRRQVGEELYSASPADCFEGSRGEVATVKG